MKLWDLDSIFPLESTKRAFSNLEGETCELRNSAKESGFLFEIGLRREISVKLWDLSSIFPLESAKRAQNELLAILGPRQFSNSAKESGFLVENGFRRVISVKLWELYSIFPLESAKQPQNELLAIWGAKRVNTGIPSANMDSLSKMY